VWLEISRSSLAHCAWFVGSDVDDDGRPSREDLVIKKGDVIKVLGDDPTGWWIGELNGQKGRFPSNIGERVAAPAGATDKQAKAADSKATTTSSSAGDSKSVKPAASANSNSSTAAVSAPAPAFFVRALADYR